MSIGIFYLHPHLQGLDVLSQKRQIHPGAFSLRNKPQRHVHRCLTSHASSNLPTCQTTTTYVLQNCTILSGNRTLFTESNIVSSAVSLLQKAIVLFQRVFCSFGVDGKRMGSDFGTWGRDVSIFTNNLFDWITLCLQAGFAVPAIRAMWNGPLDRSKVMKIALRSCHAFTTGNPQKHTSSSSSRSSSYITITKLELSR